MAGIEALKVAVLYGSVRRDRQGIRAARFVEESHCPRFVTRLMATARMPVPKA